MHAVLLCGGSKRGEVDVCGDVLLAGSLIGIGARGVLAKCGDTTAVAAGELLLARISVVDGDEDATIYVGSDARHGLLRH